MRLSKAHTPRQRLPVFPQQGPCTGQSCGFFPVPEATYPAGCCEIPCQHSLPSLSVQVRDTPPLPCGCKASVPAPPVFPRLFATAVRSPPGRDRETGKDTKTAFFPIGSYIAIPFFFRVRKGKGLQKRSQRTEFFVLQTALLPMDGKADDFFHRLCLQ